MDKRAEAIGRNSESRYEISQRDLDEAEEEIMRSESLGDQEAAALAYRYINARAEVWSHRAALEAESVTDDKSEESKSRSAIVREMSEHSKQYHIAALEAGGGKYTKLKAALLDVSDIVQGMSGIKEGFGQRLKQLAERIPDIGKPLGGARDRID